MRYPSSSAVSRPMARGCLAGLMMLSFWGTVPAATCGPEDPMVDLMIQRGAGGYQPIWDMEDFYAKLKPLEKGDDMHPLQHLAEYIFYEEGTRKAPSPLRTGHEARLYRLIKQHAMSRSGEQLSPDTILDMALRAGRDDDGRANVPIAFLTAHNVTRMLARPEQWERTMKGDRGHDPNDPMNPLFADLTGAAAAGDLPMLPEILRSQGRMRVKVVRGRLSLGKTWSTDLFAPAPDPRAIFSTLPRSTNASYNAGSHYYHWVGALAQTTAGAVAREGAIALEQSIKGLQGMWERGVIQGVGYDLGGQLAVRLEKALGGPLAAIMRLKHPELRRLGLQQQTWDAMLLKSNFYRNLEINLSHARDYVRIIGALEAAERIEKPEKRREALDRAYRRFYGLLDPILAGLEDGASTFLAEMSEAQMLALKKRLVKAIKDAAGPPTRIHCRLVFEPPTSPYASQPIDGRVLYHAGHSRIQDLGGRREIDLELYSIDDLDGLFAHEGRVQLVLGRPLVRVQTRHLRSADLDSDTDCGLTAEMRFVIEEVRIQTALTEEVVKTPALEKVWIIVTDKSYTPPAVHRIKGMMRLKAGETRGKALRRKQQEYLARNPGFKSNPKIEVSIAQR